MKTIKVSIILILMLLGSSVLYGQQGMGMHQNLPGLTDDQKAQIEKLKLAHLKDVQNAKNQIAENRAHFNTLMTADKPDMNAINKNIDEFAALQADMMKKQAAHKQDIRKILTEEQRLVFDSEKNGFGRGMKQGGKMGEGRMGHGHGDGQMDSGKGCNNPDCPMHKMQDKK